jgi:hypothetical protein
MVSNEKRTNSVKANLEDAVYMDFCWASEQEQRTQGDMLNHIIKRYLYGHSHKIHHCVKTCHCTNSSD